MEASLQILSIQWKQEHKMLKYLICRKGNAVPFHSTRNGTASNMATTRMGTHIFNEQASMVHVYERVGVI